MPGVFCYDVNQGNQSEAARPPEPEGINALQTKERRDANVCYIFGFNPICDIIGCPCWFVSSDLQGQRRIAAIVAPMTAR